MSCAVIVQVFIGLADFLAGVDIPATDHPEATLPTFDQPPQQVAARTRPIHFLGDLRIALQLALGLLKHLAVHLHSADKYHRLTRSTVTRTKSPRREGYYDVTAALCPVVTPSKQIVQAHVAP
jgi:hypothetical protein